MDDDLGVGHVIESVSHKLETIVNLVIGSDKSTESAGIIQAHLPTSSSASPGIPSESDCYCLTFKHAQTQMWEGGEYTEEEEADDDVFMDNRQTFGMKIKKYTRPCANGERCIGRTKHFPLVEDLRKGNSMILMAFRRHDEKEAPVGRKCLLCYCDEMHSLFLLHQTSMVPHYEEKKQAQQFYAMTNGEFLGDCLLHPQTNGFNGLIAPVPLFRFDRIVLRWHAPTNRRYVDISSMKAADQFTVPLKQFPAMLHSASKNRPSGASS